METLNKQTTKTHKEIATSQYIDFFNSIRELSCELSFSDFKIQLSRISYILLVAYPNLEKNERNRNDAIELRNTEGKIKLIIINIIYLYISIRNDKGYESIGFKLKDNIKTLEKLIFDYELLKDQIPDEINEKISNIIGLCYCLYKQIDKGFEIFDTIIKNSKNIEMINAAKLNKLLYKTSIIGGKVEILYTKKQILGETINEEINVEINKLNSLFEEISNFGDEISKSILLSNQTKLNIIDIFEGKDQTKKNSNINLIIDLLIQYLKNPEIKKIGNYSIELYFIILLSISNTSLLIKKAKLIESESIDISEKINEFIIMLKQKISGIDIGNLKTTSIENKYIIELINNITNGLSGFFDTYNSGEPVNEILIQVEKTLENNIIPGSSNRFSMKNIRDIIWNKHKNTHKIK